MNRRTATEQDLQIGTRVFRGRGTAEYEVSEIREPRGLGADLTPNTHRTYLLRKIGTKRGAARAYRASDLIVSEQTGIEILQDLLRLED